MQLRHRLVALGVGGTVITALVLFVVGALESGRFSDHARTSVKQLSTEDLDHVAQGVTRLAMAVGDAVQGSVNRAQQVAITELNQRGGLRLAPETVTWQATNQLTQAVAAVTLPRVTVGGVWLEPHPAVPAELLTLIRRAMHKKSHERHSDAADLSTDLTRYLTGWRTS